jgi:hypothetical protein
MLTLFSVPKPFQGHVAQLQRNAIATWADLEEVEVILFGDDDGTAEAARAAGVRHVGALERTALGAPRIDSLFAAAERERAGSPLAFVNADVLLPAAFSSALREAALRLGSFVGVGQCLDLDLGGALPGDWEAVGRSRGTPRGPGAIDYLVFSPGQFRGMPPFALGRAYFDNWLVWKARKAGVPVVDLTAVVTAVHQVHDYSHVTGGKETAYGGEDALSNLRLAGGTLHLYNIDDATHRLTPQGLRRNRLAPLRALDPARWLALRYGVLERALRRKAAALTARHRA